ncbi:hypothetical protein JRQ81_009960 [Phrynocephalus forsythii]|uniref:Uncharacterized protein n=1 Tax=Phrynocephalus forsythii TaxID=171643 RepID=A0A9Q0XB62_9SAUR|nr:hypothetical protein JRQ81_009960 [Phrynocephalus forsythii]
MTVPGVPSPSTHLVVIDCTAGLLQGHNHLHLCIQGPLGGSFRGLDKLRVVADVDLEARGPTDKEGCGALRDGPGAKIKQAMRFYQHRYKSEDRMVLIRARQERARCYRQIPQLDYKSQHPQPTRHSQNWRVRKAPACGLNPVADFRPTESLWNEQLPPRL